MHSKPYTIHNEVLLSESNTAFLIGGNHSVLDYITGKKRPTLSSLRNFAKNIASRSHIAKLCDCKYLHVIFPDKQSVLREDFPIKETVRLGDVYLRSISNTPLHDAVLFPVAKLKSTSHHDSYQKLDTHLSDHGSLLVLEEILKQLNEDAGTALEELESQITIKRKTHGDLGGKFEPKLTQESIHLRTNWNHRHFNSGGTFNNGQVDIYLSPDAPVQKKVLIFGDSFYRMMLRHLSKVFSEVIFLRTPYLHTEMVQLIKPNIILTGNSERYLADVASDSDAPAFQVYSYHHHAQIKPSPLFIHAFKAVTSPNAATSKIFFQQVLDDTSQPKIIAGPSHIVRWGQHLKHRDLDRPASPSDLIGYGGAPVWSKKIFDRVHEKNQQHTKTLLMIGDFRFGNEICLKENHRALPLFMSEFSGINAKAISPENDSFMLQRCIKALQTWNSSLNNNIKFIFWDVFCRQVQDRLAGRHITDKKYNHPHWNLVPLQTALPGNRVIDLTPLTLLPMHEAMRLFIDGSSHPSLIGYKFIINCFAFETDTVTAYNKAIDDVEEQLFIAIANAVGRKGSNITITGQSVWLDTLMRYLGPSGLEKVNRRGLFLLPVNPQIGFGADSHQKTEHILESTTVFISTNGRLTDLTPEGRNKFDLYDIPLDKSISIPWEASCANAISARNEKPLSLHGQINTQSETALLTLTDSEVELGPFGYPTLQGLVKLFDSI